MDLTKLQEYFTSLKHEKFDLENSLNSKIGFAKIRIESRLKIVSDKIKLEEYAYGFIDQAATDPEKFVNFIYYGAFFSIKHDVRDCEQDECENCYSEDTEFEAKENLINATKELLKI